MSHITIANLKHFYSAAYQDYKKAMQRVQACISDMNEARECWKAHFGDPKELDETFKLNSFIQRD
jgi:hypothetical protein